MIKKGQLLFLSHVFVAKLLKRYSVAVNLFISSLPVILFTHSNLAFPPSLAFFFQFGFWVSATYQNAFYEGINQLLPHIIWHQSSVFTLLNFSAVFDPADDYSFLSSSGTSFSEYAEKRGEWRVFFSCAFGCVLTPLFPLSCIFLSSNMLISFITFEATFNRMITFPVSETQSACF